VARKAHQHGCGVLLPNLLIDGLFTPSEAHAHMARHLPSLSALRAFEATARHLSFTRAAIELNLTQTAMSHRIKELEVLLSVQLFTRKQNTVALTDVGRAYLDAIRPALAQIAVATDGVSSQRENRLKISCLFAFALKRLVPALPDFRLRHPGIALRITPFTAPAQAEQQDFDVAIWHGPGDWPGFDVQRIASEEIFPVCTPALLAAGPRLETPDDLGRHTVVRTVSPIIVDEWPIWIKHAGAVPAEFGSEIWCDGLVLSLDAVMSGLGLGIGRTSLVSDDLASGRLVEPFKLRLTSDSAYHVVTRPDKSALSKVTKFKAWLLDRLGSPDDGPV
jgi:LysR family glycine cleavage system transcriptional activator